MFAPRFATLVFVAFLGIVKVAGIPVPVAQRTVARRGPAPFEPIQAYVKRDTTPIPEEIAAKAPNGLTVLYAKRDTPIPEEIAAKAPNGVTVLYTKRDTPIPEEIAAKAPNGVTVLYAKRDTGLDTILGEAAAQAPQGTL